MVTAAGSAVAWVVLLANVRTHGAVFEQLEKDADTALYIEICLAALFSSANYIIVHIYHCAGARGIKENHIRNNMRDNIRNFYMLA